MNSKAKGNRLERKTIQLLEAAGYQCMRSAASLGPFDVIAMNRLGMRCIQVKSNGWPSPAERENLQGIARRLPVTAIVECWRWNDREPRPLIRLLDEF